MDTIDLKKFESRADNGPNSPVTNLYTYTICTYEK